MMDREGTGVRSHAAATLGAVSPVARPAGRVSRWLTAALVALVLMATAGFALLQPVPAFASKPGEAAYYEERWQECLQKVKPVETGLPVWDGRPEGTEPTETEMGDDGVEYRLARTAEEFRWCLVNNVSVKLMNDIDLGWRGEADDPNWNGISIRKTVVIDGGGYTVYNLNSMGNGQRLGLIGLVENNVDFFMSRLILENANVSSTYGACASLVYLFKSGVVEDCLVRNALVNGNGGRAQGTGGVFAPNGAGGTGITIKNVLADNVNVRGGQCTSGFIEGSWGAKSLTIEGSMLVNSTMISQGGHSGGFTSCVRLSGEGVYRDCFADVDVYANDITGVFEDIIHGGTHTFERCGASGKIEGTRYIGGFLGRTPNRRAL